MNQDKINELAAALPIQSFQSALLEDSSFNTHARLRQVLSNMLALYYAGTESINSRYSSEAYASLCMKRLKLFLSTQDLREYSFAQALSLFAVAISEESTYSDNIGNDILKTNDIIAEYLEQIINDVKKDKELKKNILFILNQKGALQDKVQYILNNKDRLLFKEPALTSTQEPLLSNTNRLFGASVTVGASILIMSSLLGPIGAVICLPISFYSLSLGGKIAEKANQLFEQSAKVHNNNVSYMQSIKHDELGALYKVLSNKLDKTQLISNNKRLNNLPHKPNIEELNGIGNIVDVLNKSQALKTKLKKANDSNKAQQNQELRKR